MMPREANNAQSPEQTPSRLPLAQGIYQWKETLANSSSAQFKAPIERKVQHDEVAGWGHGPKPRAEVFDRPKLVVAKVKPSTKADHPQKFHERYGKHAHPSHCCFIVPEIQCRTSPETLRYICAHEAVNV
ncbi:hypothetical protein CERZMDRAFT_95680 [Cercospora zeae-maydis SCOH1-5]|uniref:Uncharacterized protein n=1 Tax=Cercospora zeae-maydis SCOH1-5 TaxID=717836 RepID=A0A6A6FM45_9PEZI|nr:hypothetical protein CERZMDRAFT_95680 [Cercospora zeae-maydis SCOH1-5]